MLKQGVIITGVVHDEGESLRKEVWAQKLARGKQNIAYLRLNTVPLQGIPDSICHILPRVLADKFPEINQAFL